MRKTNDSKQTQKDCTEKNCGSKKNGKCSEKNTKNCK